MVVSKRCAQVVWGMLSGSYYPRTVLKQGACHKVARSRDDQGISLASRDTVWCSHTASCVRCTETPCAVPCLLPGKAHSSVWESLHQGERSIPGGALAQHDSTAQHLPPPCRPAWYQPAHLASGAGAQRYPPETQSLTWGLVTCALP